eukprot:TRINITY_DN38750_c0_g2_i1.p1 TRINITY_DN38750_c0_g2~~TRINITY_DN38750_c0_g2_i1.p1  ORF type:complete len:379 (-),score=4.35 TRINITY_DN38750_c0_g2_i1:11-1093(-)
MSRYILGLRDYRLLQALEWNRWVPDQVIADDQNGIGHGYTVSPLDNTIQKLVLDHIMTQSRALEEAQRENGLMAEGRVADFLELKVCKRARMRRHLFRDIFMAPMSSGGDGTSGATSSGSRSDIPIEGTNSGSGTTASSDSLSKSTATTAPCGTRQSWYLECLEVDCETSVLGARCTGDPTAGRLDQGSSIYRVDMEKLRLYLQESSTGASPADTVSDTMDDVGGGRFFITQEDGAAIQMLVFGRVLLPTPDFLFYDRAKQVQQGAGPAMQPQESKSDQQSILSSMRWIDSKSGKTTHGISLKYMVKKGEEQFSKYVRAYGPGLVLWRRRFTGSWLDRIKDVAHAALDISPGYYQGDDLK